MHWESDTTYKPGDSSLGWMPFFHVIGFAHDLLAALYIGYRYVFVNLGQSKLPNARSIVENMLADGQITILYSYDIDQRLTCFPRPHL